MKISSIVIDDIKNVDQAIFWYEKNILNKEYLNKQENHWENTFSTRPEMFGVAPSVAATKAAERALSLLRPGYGLRFCHLPPDKDPDELPVPEVIETDTGAEEEVTTLP